MKTCRYCKKNLPEGYFEIALTTPTKVYRRRKCKRCKQNTQNKRRSKTAEWLQNYKKALSCNRCKIKDHRVLDFHHKNSDEKDFNIANGLTFSIDAIKKEIEKCEVLCSNCHRIEHYRGAV